VNLSRYAEKTLIRAITRRQDTPREISFGGRALPRIPNSGKMTINLDDWRLTFMTDSEKAAKVIEALRAAESQPAQIALPMLNGLFGQVHGDREQLLEVEEARADTFLAICEVGKALHRGQSADRLWTSAIDAAERWMLLARRSYWPGHSRRPRSPA
jgi:hypothetical protein